MSRISQRLGAVKSEHKKAFVAFVTAGDPSLDRTVEVALAFDDAGVDVLELESRSRTRWPTAPSSSGPATARCARARGSWTSWRRCGGSAALPTCPCCSSRISIRCSATASTRSPGMRSRRARTACWSRTCRPRKRTGGSGRAAGRPRYRVPGRAHQPRRAAPEGRRGFARVRVRGEPDRRHRRARRDLGRSSSLVRRIKALTREPVVLGFGLSTPEQVRRRRRSRTEWSWERAGALPGGAPARRRGGSGAMAQERDVKPAAPPRPRPRRPSGGAASTSSTAS